MKRNKYIRGISFLAFMLVAISSCTHMDDYKSFIEGGEISYTGKIDSVTVYSGDQRVLIKGLFIADPKVTGCMIYWNSREDSVDVDIQRSQGVDTLQYILPLAENMYNFEFFTYDALGNRSIPVHATGRSYGAAYKASLNNRLVNSAAIDGNQVDIVWRSIDKTLGAFATRVTYTDNNGAEQTVTTSVDQAQTVLEDYKKGSQFSAITLYRPDTLCIDTFYTIAEKYTPLVKIDKTNWTATADTYEETGKLPEGGSPDFAIDDDPATYWHTKQAFGGSPYPHWLAVDMGEEKEVVAITLTALSGQLDGDFRDFIIQGKKIDTDKWTDYGSHTLDDIDGPQLFSLDAPANLRHIRIQMLNGKNQHAYLAEISAFEY